jgi:hypothetical protein
MAFDSQIWHQRGFVNRFYSIEEQLREWVQSAQKRSPVFDIVSHPVPVSVELKNDS